MTREELFQLHTELTTKGLELMKKKNADYAKSGPFENFKMCEARGAVSAEIGILIRLDDKISRLYSILEKGTQVVSESEEDTLVDIINYAVCIAGLRREKQLDNHVNAAISVTFPSASGKQ